MKPRHQVSSTGLTLIKRFEGYRRGAAQLADGRWTIGHGHTRSAREGAEVSEADAEALLLYDLIAVTDALNAQVFTPLTQNQVDALASFIFNIGVENFRRSSVLRRLNEGAMIEAAYAIEMWRKADFEGERIVVDALVRRRSAEKTLFLTPSDGWTPAPTPVIEPKLDYALAVHAPATAPAALKAPLEGEITTVVRVDAPAPEDSEPSPTEAAAEAVKARLEALMADLDDRIFPPIENEASGDPAEAIETATPQSPHPFGALGSEDAPSYQADLRPEPRPIAPPNDAQARLTDDKPGPVGWSMFNPPVDKAAAPSVYSLAGLGLLGLAIFAGAALWMSKAKPASGLMGPFGLGVVAAVVGVLCVVAAIYFLLEQLSAHDR